jgi:subfamily B ATP-binding cassette protein MsbA
MNFTVASLMGLVTQDSILFNDTIKAISIGKLDATDDEIIEALENRNAYEFVNELQGIHTNIETVVTNFLVVKTKDFLSLVLF